MLTNSTLVLNNVNFVNAFSSTNGGAINVSDADSSLTISNSVFENNSATASSANAGVGGAIYSKGFITFKDNVAFKNNGASYRGGAIYADAGFNITGNNFYAIGNCLPKGVLGGFIYSKGDDYISGKNMLFANNYATGSSAYGGATIYVYNFLSIVGENITFNNNSVGLGGGAICADQITLAVNDLIFINNVAKTGGAIRSYDDCYIEGTNILFVNNSVSGDNGYEHGGAIYNWDVGLTVSDSTFVNNSAITKGGAIYESYGNTENTHSFIGSNLIFISNLASLGDAVYTEASNVNISNSAFVNHTHAVYRATSPDRETIDLDDNWWDSNSPVWPDVLVNIDAPKTYAVLDVSTNKVSDKSYDVIANMYWNGTTNKANVPTRTIDLSVNGGSINPASGVFDNGTFTAIFSANKTGNYTVIDVVDNEVQNMDISVIGRGYDLIVEDIEKYFKGDEDLVAKVVDGNNNPIANATVVFNINGINYTRTTDVNGSASMAINLASGTYDVTTIYNNLTVKSSVVVKSTIGGSNIVKMYQNDTQFFATFLDSNGNALANTTVKFNINGVFYQRQTDSNGTARLNINLNPGNYTLTAINPENGEEKGFNVLVKSLIETSDLSKYYLNASKFEAKVYNKDGSLAVNKSVSFNINGVLYTRETDSNGVVSLAINLRPGNYTITTLYEGLSVGNKVSVLSTLETKDLSMTFQDGSKFQVKTLNDQGRPLANQNITFNVNGVFYHKTTGSDGIASLNINLMKGEYIITSYWNNYETGNKISIA